MMARAVDWDVAIVLVLAASVTMYATGLTRLWRRAGRWRGVGTMNVAAFAGGIGAIVVALLSPIDRLSDVLFSAHMGQHELLMLVAAPLLVVGKPWLTGAWSLPERLRVRALARLQQPPLRRSWRAVSAPVTILVLHALALWIWHVPALFEAAMRDERVHAFQHLGFFVTAAIFWWALAAWALRPGPVMAPRALFVFLTGDAQRDSRRADHLRRAVCVSAATGRATRAAGIRSHGGPAGCRASDVDTRPGFLMALGPRLSGRLAGRGRTAGAARRARRHGGPAARGAPHAARRGGGLSSVRRCRECHASNPTSGHHPHDGWAHPRCSSRARGEDKKTSRGSRPPAIG